MVFKIGVTGGMASGKSSCLKHLKTKPMVMTLDLDPLAHTVYDIEAVRQKIIASFGAECYGPTNKIDRPVLAQKAFKDSESSKTLSQIVGPAIVDLIEKNFLKAR